MSLSVNYYRFIVLNLLTLYYSVIVLVAIIIKYLKNPLSDPWATKLKLEPPPCLTDPKFGVHKYIKVNNVKLHYVESGDPSKELMIFIHGFPEFWYSWRHQIVEFNKNYWCIAVDMRGYADSEKPDAVSSYHLDILAEDIRDLLRQLGREKCILVSHDWGGLVACHFRDIYPHNVAALIMLGAPTRESWFNLIWKDREQRNMSWYTFYYRMPKLPEKFIQMHDLEILNELMPTNGTTVTEQDVECYKYWLRKQCALTPPVNYYRANITHVLKDKRLCELKIPFLYVLGAKDPYLSNKLIDEVKLGYQYVETVLLENTEHFLQQENPEPVNKLIKEFLPKHNL